MEFKLNIKCDNVAFEDYPEIEIARLLRKVANTMGRGEQKKALMDANGNKVGSYELS